MSPKTDDLAELPTEASNPHSLRLGTMSAREVIDLMAAADLDAVAAVDRAAAGLTLLAERIASTFSRGGRTVLVGAGTSGRLALQEVSELPPTFGVPEHQFLALVASRAPLGPAAVAPDEDETDLVVQALRDLRLGERDTVVGLAASGRTPFALAGVQQAGEAGAFSCGIANNPGTPLLHAGALGVLLDTGPEILTGSTRLKAGTAQKLALNRATTAAMVIAGRVRGNHMTHLRASNAKLRARAVRIVADCCGTDHEQARLWLIEQAWDVQRTLERAPQTSVVAGTARGSEHA